MISRNIKHNKHVKYAKDIRNWFNKDRGGISTWSSTKKARDELKIRKHVIPLSNANRAITNNSDEGISIRFLYRNIQ